MKFYNKQKHHNYILFFLILSFPLFAGEVVYPSIEELFTVPETWKSCGEDIIKTSLMFSLCDENSELWNASVEKYSQIRKCGIDEKLSEMDERARAERINELMYERCLTKYKKNQTKTSVMFNEGTYNCVSSSILYFALATDFGIDARIQETPQHAFITVYLKDGTKIDVETTNPYGFNPGSRKLLEDDGKGNKSYAVIPKTYYSKRVEVSDRRGISIIGKNLVSAFNEQKDYATGIPLAATCYTFVKEENSRKDFDTLTTNYAIDLDRRNDTESGMYFLDAVVEQYGMTSFISSIYDRLASNATARPCNRKDYDSAEKILENHRKNISESTATQIEREIRESNAYDHLNNLKGEEGIAYLDEVKKDGLLMDDKSFSANLDRYEESYWSQMAMDLNEEEKYFEAVALCDVGIAKLPDSRVLKNTRLACLNNHGIYVHNKVVPLINSKSYEEALKILEEELEKNPSSSLIKQDIVFVKKAMK